MRFIQQWKGPISQTHMVWAIYLHMLEKYIYNIYHMWMSTEATTLSSTFDTLWNAQQLKLSLLICFRSYQALSIESQVTLLKSQA